MTGATLDFDRGRVLAYRVVAHQLDRSVRGAAKLAVLDLGVQDTPYGSARLALAARLATSVDDPALALVWSTRGAPHLHRVADLPGLARALWPLSDADATARIASSHIREGAKLGLTAFTATAQAMHEVVTAPMSKGEVSAAVSAKVPPSLTYDCASCAARHISGGIFQQVGVLAGVRLDPAGSGTTLTPVDGWPGIPTSAEGTDELVRTYLRLLGPATPAEAAKFLGTTAAQVKGAWPDGLVEVRVEGARTWLPQDSVEALRGAPRPKLVRLLPPADPFLQTRNRDLLLPDTKRQKELWRILASPGALLVDGDVAGTWRAKLAGRNRLEVTVTPFETLTAGVRKAVDTEAGHVAAARATNDVVVKLEG